MPYSPEMIAKILAEAPLSVKLREELAHVAGEHGHKVLHLLEREHGAEITQHITTALDVDGDGQVLDIFSDTLAVISEWLSDTF
ncbi:hypothetical protein [Megalodesulfovibrio gigas]|uniref:Uncharacterized protein n=1 Tax=Megalodesulfovibrio gigas (strain ATCC 19364 / DSM 1382 / NCIMB 9332 / VKM B-1759) TaxID=1121448 RepID=T2G870_MEGG1|nr:hypothetical protein [Megalodesulfovibrio gigas]AGW12785.1 hypothetical protein DGI_0894 [Megalodesulfovibrio gigas DSM 1382 = ATCC 19364]